MDWILFLNETLICGFILETLLQTTVKTISSKIIENISHRIRTPLTSVWDQLKSHTWSWEVLAETEHQKRCQSSKAIKLSYAQITWNSSYDHCRCCLWSRSDCKLCTAVHIMPYHKLTCWWPISHTEQQMTKVTKVKKKTILETENLLMGLLR